MASEYEIELSNKLEAARKRVKYSNEMKHVKSVAPTLFSIIDDEMSILLNKMTQDEPLSNEEYLDAHGKFMGMKRIRNLIDAKELDGIAASQEVDAIQDQLKQFDNDKKQQ